MIEKYYAEIYKLFDEPEQLFLLLRKIIKKTKIAKFFVWIDIALLLIMVFLISKSYINIYLGITILVILFSSMLKIVEILKAYDEIHTQIDLVISFNLINNNSGEVLHEKIQSH